MLLYSRMILRLPDELLEMIVDNLPVGERFIFYSVCKRFHALNDVSQNGSHQDINLIYKLCWANNTMLIQWLRELNYRYSLRVSSKTAQYGHIKLLAWLIDDGCPYNEYLMASAAKFGHKHILDWAVDRRMEKHPLVCAYAAKGGQLDTLKWLRARRFPWDSRAYQWAVKKQHVNVAEYILEHGGDADSTQYVMMFSEDELYEMGRRRRRQELERSRRQLN